MTAIDEYQYHTSLTVTVNQGQCVMGDSVTLLLVGAYGDETRGTPRGSRSTENTVLALPKFSDFADNLAHYWSAW